MHLTEAEEEPERLHGAGPGAVCLPEAEPGAAGKTCLPEAEEERMCLPGVGREAAGAVEHRPSSGARFV